MVLDFSDATGCRLSVACNALAANGWSLNQALSAYEALPPGANIARLRGNLTNEQCKIARVVAFCDIPEAQARELLVANNWSIFRSILAG